MPKTNKKNRTRVFNVLKFVWAVIIFYLWLKMFVPSTVREDLISENMYEWNEMSVLDNLDPDLQAQRWKHDVANTWYGWIGDEGLKDADGVDYGTLFQNICITNNLFCNKIQFNWDYLQKDKYIYLASIVYILKFIENNIQIWTPMSEQLWTIIINDMYNTRRWYATWTEVTLNLGSVSSYAEFMELVSHELWHIVDLWLVKWYSIQKDYNFTEFGNVVFSTDDASLSYYEISWDSETIRKATSTVADFCSSYGMSDPFEDFAECHNLYLNHNSIFKLWAQNNDAMRQKYNFFANLYGGKFMFNASSDLDKYGSMINTRPWDSTKM